MHVLDRPEKVYNKYIFLNKFKAEPGKFKTKQTCDRERSPKLLVYTNPNPHYIVQEQVFRKGGGNERGDILPMTSQCTIKIIFKLLF